MPSTTSTTVSRLLPSSTVMTPSLPTLAKASAMILPTVGSLLALIEATEAMPPWTLATGRAIDLICSTTASTPFRMPRTRALGSIPAARRLAPALKRASARTVAVVVPSPASSEVLLAASFTSLAPMFSTLLRSSISSATETPSLVTVGPPQLLSRTALRPRGPSVLLTAAASLLTPLKSCLRASVSKASSFTAMSRISRRWSRLPRIAMPGGGKEEVRAIPRPPVQPIRQRERLGRVGTHGLGLNPGAVRGNRCEAGWGDGSPP